MTQTDEGLDKDWDACVPQVHLGAGILLHGVFRYPWGFFGHLLEVFWNILGFLYSLGVEWYTSGGGAVWIFLFFFVCCLVHLRGFVVCVSGFITFEQQQMLGVPYLPQN